MLDCGVYETVVVALVGSTDVEGVAIEHWW